MRVEALICFLAIHNLSAQLNNEFFIRGTELPKTKLGLTVDGMQYLKNNEYFNAINPGETWFGFQASAAAHYKIHSSLTFSAGFLAQKEFGSSSFFSKASPIFNFGLKKGKWNLNLGTVRPHVFHGLPDAMYSYENILTQPVELGLQALRNGPGSQYDGWLNWRQMLNKEKGLREQIVFGQSLIQNLYNGKKWRLNMPIAGTIYHSGGQNLNVPGHLVTRIQAAAAIRMGRQDSSFAIEYYVLSSFDNSPTLSQPFGDGWANMVNARIRIKKYHSIAATWWYGREFVTDLGNQIFSSVNVENGYANSAVRRLVMLRYVFCKPLVSGLWMDFRLEPHYDFEYGKAEFSHGLYFRYVKPIDIRLPKFPGLF